MNRLLAAAVALALLSLTAPPARAKEPFARLDDYARRADAIAICVVDRDNGDGSVTVSVTRVLKGDLKKAAVIRGNTGFGAGEGPVSRFMAARRKYLVFLFQGDTPGRLGGILAVQEDKTLVFSYLSGFAGVRHDKDNFLIQRLPLADGIKQIGALVKEDR
jgi:hypothetical protein